MSFLGILPPLLFSAAFLLPAVYLWRSDRRGYALVPAFTALLLLSFTVAVYIQDVKRIQALHDLDVLLAEIDRPELLDLTDLNDHEELLFLASAASQALYRGLEYAPPATQDRIDVALLYLADWVTDRSNFREWRRGVDWDRQVFFAAHAGAVLGHYQLATGDERFATQFQRVGETLGTRLRRARYKHLASRPEEGFLRPADNAAALYATSLYDQYYGETYTAGSLEEWAEYVRRELYFAESRLPCAAFNATNVCRLEPSAVATGLYISYRAAARPAAVTNDIPFVEWSHYFRRGNFTPFSLTVSPNMRAGRDTKFCEIGVQPLRCGRYERSVGLWAASEYGGWYTYFRLFTGPVLRRWLRGRPDFGGLTGPGRTVAVTGLALRLIGEGHR